MELFSIHASSSTSFELSDKSSLRLETPDCFSLGLSVSKPIGVYSYGSYRRTLIRTVCSLTAAARSQRAERKRCVALYGKDFRKRVF